MATLNQKIRDYVQNIGKGGQPNLETFFNNNQNHAAIDNCIQSMAQHKGRKTIAAPVLSEELREKFKGTSQNATTSTTSSVTPATAAANADSGMTDICIGRNINRRRSSGTIPEPVTIGEIPEFHLKFNTHFDITDHWHQYKAKSLDTVNRVNLQISSDLQKVMSFCHIMLLSPDTNDDDMIEIFGANNLDDYYTA
ncbi:hypothetical protein BDC45DRAFT_575441 [Circinella umbellata]|nr:hypothetical protein BDC45DRAFT_575441 [Circinella umbellata]